MIVSIVLKNPRPSVFDGILPVGLNLLKDQIRCFLTELCEREHVGVRLTDVHVEPTDNGRMRLRIACEDIDYPSLVEPLFPTLQKALKAASLGDFAEVADNNPTALAACADAFFAKLPSEDADKLCAGMVKLLQKDICAALDRVLEEKKIGWRTERVMVLSNI